MKKPRVQEPQRAPMPKLSGETKAMNGKSSRKLMQCIDNLHGILDGQECQLDETDRQDVRDSDTRATE